MRLYRTFAENGIAQISKEDRNGNTQLVGHIRLEEGVPCFRPTRSRRSSLNLEELQNLCFFLETFPKEP